MGMKSTYIPADIGMLIAHHISASCLAAFQDQQCVQVCHYGVASSVLRERHTYLLALQQPDLQQIFVV